MRDTRLLWVLAGAAAVLVLFVVLRPGGDDEDDAAASTGETTTAGETATVTTNETAPTTTAPPQPDVVTIRLAVRGGLPVGGVARPSVKKGRRVRIVVRSDVADNAHLHGYDIERDVAPGAPAQIVFTADLPGRFELELEERGVQLAELEVRP